MTKDEIKAICEGDFYENFTQQNAAMIISEDSFDALFSVYKDSDSDKVAFRSAYIIETVYFFYSDVFRPYRDEFLTLFPLVENRSARRHYAKITAHILKSYIPDNAESIAEACLNWIIAPKTKVAVQIWCIEILLILRKKIEWVYGAIVDILETLSTYESPAIRVRMKIWRKELFY